MNKNEYYSIGEFSEKTAISVRTLHYYDEIGLLKPEKHPSSGHRLYTNQDMLTLQMIISLKFLGYRLDQISGMIYKSSFDLSLNEALEIQKKVLEERKDHIENVLRAIKRTMILLEEEDEIDSTILMSLIKNIQMENEQRHWFKKHTSKTVVEQLFKKTEDEMFAMDKEYVRFCNEVKRLVGKPVNDSEVQELVGKWLKLVEESIHSTFELISEDVKHSICELEKVKGYECEHILPSPFTKEEEVWLEQAIDYYYGSK